MIRQSLSPYALISVCALASSVHAQDARKLAPLFTSGAPAQVRIDGHAYTLTPERTTSYEMIDAISARGSVGNGGTFVLAQGPIGIEGAMWIEDRVYTIRGTNGGEVEVLPFEMPPGVTECPGGIRPAAPQPTDVRDEPITTQDDVPRVGGIEPTRVLVVYNTDARDDVSDINAYIAAMIESANEAYVNSETEQVEIELAGAYLFDEAFSDDFGTVLRQVTNRYDGVGDAMHTLRDATDADVIAMLVDQPGYCGLAWLAPGNAEYAMSVSDTDCALGNLTFAHELGHNQGCAHDPDNAGSSSAPYGYGHRWNNNSRRSVMAYSPGTRVPQFSNPDVLNNGFPTGIANQRDNARVLDETHDAMSTMRLGDGSGPDNDASGVPDRLELALDPALDLDRNGEIDSVQIANDPALDCNNDGIIDDEQVFPRVRVMVGTTTQFGSGIEPVFNTESLPAPISDVQIQVGIAGDVGSSSENLTLRFNSGLFTTDVFTGTSSDCYAPGLISTVNANALHFAPILEEGIELRVIPTGAVDADVCSSPNLTVWIEYRTHDLDLDANGDGIIDSCACPADLNSDGELNFFDVADFIAFYNTMNPVADFNNDGEFNFFDVTQFIVQFNNGCP